MAPGASQSAADLVPGQLSYRALREGAAGCRACPLWEDATQTVFGEGRVSADVMLVGEQPGDREDIEGKPFVGPAGHVLAAALEGAGLDPRDAYVTNAVKHFKWKRKGKRRIHQRPNAMELAACAPWLDAEVLLVRPRLVVALGATAARAVIGPGFKVTRDRGTLVDSELAPLVTGTVHPSSVLRAPDDEARRLARAELERDLAAALRELDRLDD